MRAHSMNKNDVECVSEQTELRPCDADLTPSSEFHKSRSDL